MLNEINTFIQQGCIKLIKSCVVIKTFSISNILLNFVHQNPEKKYHGSYKNVQF